MIDIRAHRQKMTGNEPDAKAILPKRGASKSKFLSVPFNGYWLDIGRPDDYQVACEHFPEIKARLGISS